MVEFMVQMIDYEETLIFDLVLPRMSILEEIGRDIKTFESPNGALPL